MITHKITQTTKAETTLLISVDEQFIAPYKQSVLKRLKKNLKIDGFRPGNAPDNIVERELGEAKVQAEVLEEIIMHAYARAVREEKLETVASPQVSLKKFVPYTELEFEVVVAIMPDIKVDLKKLSVKKPAIKVDAKEVTSTLENMRVQGSKKTESKKPIQNGDEITFDFKGVREGKPVEGAAASGHVMTVGQKSFIPGFEENLLGLKTNEKKTFDVTFPKDYHAKDLAGKKVEFSVEIKKIINIELPKLDDVWAKTVGPVKDLAMLKDEIKKSLEQQKQAEADKQYENLVLEAVVKQNSFEAPGSLVDEQVGRLRAETEENLKNSGLDIEKYLQLQGQKPDEFEAQLKVEAEKRVKLGLILRTVIEQEKIVVTDAEVELELNRLESQYTDPKMQEELTHDHFRDDLKNHLLTQKAVRVFLDAASK